MKKRREHFVHYGYVPGFGFYCFGLIHLIGGFSKSGTMLLRQLVDAGTLSNLPGGFKSRGLRIKGDDTPIGPAEFRDVDVPSGTIRDNILPLPYKEPSQVLAALMDKIIDEGRRFASAADMKVSDMSANSPVGSTLAILERTLKVMSAVNARIYYSMKKELGLLKGLIRDYTDPNYKYDPASGTPGAKQSDYDKVNLIPVADPNAATMAQKVVQYQAVMQLAQQNPDIYDLPELNKQMLDVLGVKNAEKLIPNKDDVKSAAPVTENMNIINGKPVKAFLEQDHEAHIAVHMAFMQDPQVQQMVGQSTKAGLITAAMEAHIAEHIAFQYRIEIEKQLGVPLPPVEEPLPRDVENEVARLTAEAAGKVLQSSQQKAQQEEQQKQAEDPILQMQKQELQIKQQESQAKGQKMMADAQLEQAKFEFEKQKAMADAQLEQAKLKTQESIVGAKIGAEAKMKEKDTSAKEVLEGAKLGAAAINKEKDIQLRLKESQMRNDAMLQMSKQNQQNNAPKTNDSNNGENN
jgi:hypothetical protein